MPKKKRYFPNNWKEIKDAPIECFSTDDGPLSYEDFMDWKLGGWELPASVDCIIRVTNKKTKKVKEHVYSNSKWAKRKIRQLLYDGNEFTVAGGDVVQHVNEQHF